MFPPPFQKFSIRADPAVLPPFASSSTFIPGEVSDPFPPSMSNALTAAGRWSYSSFPSASSVAMPATCPRSCEMRASTSSGVTSDTFLSHG